LKHREGFIDFSKEKNSNAVMRYYEPELVRLQRTGVAVIDSNDKILEMAEKPKEPKSNWVIPPFYIFKKECLKDIKVGIESGCKTDAPGGFIELFIQRKK